ncbi:MAG TPA: tetratricopeptide repeat protein, partial [Elusimicrobiales bacterium]|nr:tetratricopeptide repeat protein [Elusimicrobiales bacterium]
MATKIRLSGLALTLSCFLSANAGPCFSQDTAALALEATRLSQSGQFDMAKQKFQQAVALSPANATLHLSLGLTCQRLNQLEEAAASLRQAAALNPSL